jgi:hypothetical protein
MPLCFHDAVSNERDVTLAQRLNGKLSHLGVLLVLAYFILGSFRPMLDNVDLGWHVAQGRWMVEHGAIYRHDVLNYPTFGRPLVNEYPVFQLVLFLAWKLGWWGPCVLTACCYAVLTGVLARAAKAFALDGSALLAGSFLTTILYLQLAFPLRPHLVTYLGIVILGVFLLRHREARSWIEFWPMALLQIAWTNSHSAFVLGPAMAGLFGLEMTLRRWVADRTLPWATARLWLGVFLLLFLACFANPFGFARFYPPLYQDQLEAIRAYVGEMQALPGAAASLYAGVTLFGAALVVLAAISRRGAISFSLLALAIPLWLESLSVQKSWPVFGLFIPLLILSSGAFARPDVAHRPVSWPGMVGNFIVTAFLAMFVIVRVDGSSNGSLQMTWREYDLGRRELSYQAVAWMKAHGIEGRLLHRCEDGGWLQEAGYDHGETFGDTGFGKYDESFIHIVAMLGERAALLPRYLEVYRPGYVVCNNFCYQWPHYLRQEGWRLIFYSPYSSVWTRPETRPDLATVSDGEIQRLFQADLADYGRPADLLLLGRNIIALNSMGLEDFAVSQLTSLPAELHRSPWYWEAARILCFEEPRLSAEHRGQLLAEADHLHDDALTAEFRAYAHDADGDVSGAEKILDALPPAALGSHASDLLLRIDLKENRPGTLALAERKDGFDLRDGEHWKYVALTEDRAGHEAAALHAWRKAVFYYPDDRDLLERAAVFAAKIRDAGLADQVASSARLPKSETPAPEATPRLP